MNGSWFEAGQQLRLGLIVRNPAGNPTAYLYTGVVFPDGVTAVFFSAPGAVGNPVSLGALPPLTPMQVVAPEASFSMTSLAEFTLPATGIPAGRYQFFAALVRDELAPGGEPRILALDMRAFTYAPEGPDPRVVGRWSTSAPLPFPPIHLHMLPTGKVMMWPGEEISGDNSILWDPATETVTAALAFSGFDIWCSGHSFLADGRLLVTGGAMYVEVGLPNAALYDPFADAWTPLPDMNAGRWYPTNTTLGNGDVLVTSGTIDARVGENYLGENSLPQVLDTASSNWRDLTGAVLELPDYPQMFLAPNGSVFYAGPERVTRYLDPLASGFWSVVATRDSDRRDFGSAVMYDDGKVLVVGGGMTPTNTTEVIDVNVPSPAWRNGAPMAFARQHPNATLLPDGTVLVTGGTSGLGFNNPDAPVYTAELWNPKTEAWTLMADTRFPRLYHSAALLLPDGRVLTAGGNKYGGVREPELYMPPYLFKGTRPTLAAPASVTYGQTFFVQTADAASIAQVTWLRLGSVTHAFNQNQRFNRLGFSRVPGGLMVVAPADPNLAPPGHYMLFVLNEAGVPSVGQIVQIQDLGRRHGAADPSPLPRDHPAHVHEHPQRVPERLDRGGGVVDAGDRDLADPVSPALGQTENLDVEAESL